MGREWKEISLGEACESIQTGPFGSQLHKADYVAKGIPSIMPVNIDDNRITTDGIARISKKDADRLSRYLVRSGDVVYSRRGDVERRALVRDREDGWLCGTGCLRVRFDSDLVNSEYASFQLGSPSSREWIVRHAIGATMPNLNTKILSALPFLLPPLSEQKAIAHILGSLDDKIELNRQMNATLEGMAQALFKSWFVDFDPVIDNALAAGNPIPEAFAARAETRRKALADGTANRDVAKQFPAAFQFTEEMGWIPEGWDVGAISDLCLKIQNGGTPKRDNDEFWKDGKIPWLTSGEVRQSMITATQSAITEYGLKMSSAKWLPSYSTVVALYGATAGQVAFISCEMSTNQAVCGLVPKKHFRYFNYLLIERKVQYFENQARGSAQQNISKGIIETTDTILPTINSIQFCEKQVQPIFEKWIQNIQINKQLSKLRDTLLPKLISGEMRISEAEKITKEALA